MAANKLGRNIEFPIYNADGTPFHDLVLRKSVVESIVMSLSDKITGDVYYKDNSLETTSGVYVKFKHDFQDANEEPIKFLLVNPPTVVREGHVKDNSELKGMTKYSFTFYHPMYQLSNMPFTDVAVNAGELSYLSEKKEFSWIGKPDDFIAKLNKNLEGTQWTVVKSDRFPTSKNDILSGVLTFNNNTIADALKTEYDTWGEPFIVDVVKNNESGYQNGKRFKIIIGLPANEIYGSQEDEQQENPFVFEFGKGVGLKNNSRTPRNNKIITRISGYGSEDNIPYGYPQIVWNGDEDDERLQYPLYDGIVGGQYVKLIKHPFTRTHLMPSIYSETVNKKVNPNAVGYNPNITLIDYYDAIYSEETPYVNPININAPSYEIHEFDIKPEFNNGGATAILGAVPLNNNLTIAEAWDDTMDDDGNYIQSYFQVTLPPLGFDVYACAAITQEMQINMRSGACIGCTFTVQVDWEQYKANFYNGSTFAPDGEQRDLTLFPNSTSASINLVLKKENTTFGTLMPSVYQHPANGDNFVFLGISLPIEYISNAEERLDDEMKDYMLANNVHYYDYPLKFDEYFLAQNTYILSQLRPNSIVRFLYNDNELQLYVKQLTIKYGDSVLPQYDITLTDNVEVVLNQIGQAVEGIEKLSSVLTSVLKQGGGSVNVSLVKSIIETYGTDLFLRKDKESTAAKIIRFLKGIKFGESNQWYINGNGEAVLNSLNVENLTAKIAHFFQLEIDEIKSVGGQIMLTPANATVFAVEDRSNTITRLYFRATDGDRKIFQTFQTGDQVICATFNAAEGTSYDVSNKFYWTVVQNVSSSTVEYNGEVCHWLDIYNENAAATYHTGYVNPEAGDEIVLLGNRSNAARQNAIIISAYDAAFIDNGYGQPSDSNYVPPIKAPSIVQYAGIDDFVLYNKRKNVISNGLNQFVGNFVTSGGESITQLISDIEAGLTTYVHQAWAENAVQNTDRSWTLTKWSLTYFTGARYMCFLSDHTQGESHLNNKSIWESAPDETAEPNVPEKKWIYFKFDIVSDDFTYALSHTSTKPADSAFTPAYPTNVSVGDYIFVREEVTYSNGTTGVSYSSQRIADDGADGIDGVSSYLHIAYASAADGSQGFSPTPLASSQYIGFCRTETSKDPEDSTLYTWSKYVGSDGLNGLSAPPTYKETTVTHKLAYESNTGVTKSTAGWDTDIVLSNQKPYMWQYDSTTYESVSGIENLLRNSTKQDNFSSLATTNATIAKIALAKQLVHGNTYSITFKAEDLAEWNGIASCSVYVYHRNAWNGANKALQVSGIKQLGDGTFRVTFTANVDMSTENNQSHRAIYIDANKAAYKTIDGEKVYPKVYWVMLTEGGVQYDWAPAPVDMNREGEPAVVSSLGRGLSGIVEQYARNNDATTAPSSGWGTTPLNTDATHQYVWNREVITYSDGTTITTTPHISSTYALGISTKEVRYAVTSTSSQPADSAFTHTTVPTVNKGEYLWTKTEITYGDNSVTKAYSVSYKATDGTSPYFADIDNEMDSVACTSAGKPSSAQTVSTTVSFYFGSTRQNCKITGVKRNGTAMTTGTAVSGITPTFPSAAGSTRTLSLAYSTSATVSKDTYEITVTDSNGNNSRTLYFVVNGIKAGANGTNGTNGTNGADGADGANAVIYNIVPEKDSINVARDGSAYVPANVSITCGYVKNDGGTATKVNDVSSRIDSKYNLYFRRRTRSNQAWETKYYLYNNGTTSYKSYLTSLAVATYDAVEFVLSTATAAQPATGSIGTVIDRETVPIVSDGEEGNGIKKVTVTYAGSTSGTTAPSSGWQSTVPSVALGNFLWTRSITEYTDTSVVNTTSYSVSRIGADGANGTPGQPGADGRTPYFHTAYANSADGSVNFSTTYFTGASYIGTCTDYNEGDPSTYSSYEWAELRGMDNAGVYVTDVKNYYKVTNTNATPAIDNTWVLCPPGTIPQPTNTNRYLWNYEVTEYGCQYPNMVLNSDNPTIGGDPYLFRFNSTNEFVHGEVYSFAMKLGQLPSPKTYYCLQIQGAVQKNGETIHNSRAISQSVGQNPTSPPRLVPNEDGIIMGTFKCDIYVDDLEGYIDQTQHIWVSAYPSGGTYDVPSFDWITVVKGTQVASWSKALSELTQTIPPHLIATQGEKGDSAWVADLTNEMDSVQCDDTGYVVSQQSVSTALSLFYGVSEKNFGTPTVKRNGSTITIGTTYDWGKVTYSSKTLTVTYYTAAKITGKDEFAITLTASDDSSTVRTLTFTVNGVVGDVYNLLPKDQNINATRDEAGHYLVNGSSTFPLVCGYTKNVNGVVTTVESLEDWDIEGKYRIFIRIRRRSDGKWQLWDESKTPNINYETGVPLYNRFRGADLVKSGTTYTRSMVNINTYDAIEFILTDQGEDRKGGWATTNTNAIDSETIYVVADGINGTKGDFQSTVFKRQNTKPATPTGGTYASPVPSGWSDSIPAGAEMVWASTRTFKVDDTSTTWSTPRQMTDTTTYDVEFAKMQSQDATPAKPTDANRHGGSGTQVWFDPAQDTSEDYTQMYWRAERECSNGTWSDWVIVRIKGESGAMITNAVLTRSNTASWWQGKCGGTTSSGWSDPDGIIPADMRVGDIFVVQGEATDTGDFYTIYMRYDRTSGTTKYGTPVSYTISRKGTDGKAGTSVTITKTETRYRKAASVTDTDAWWNGGSTTFPSVNPGDTVWSRTVVTYSDGSTTKTVGSSRIGTDGSDGLPGSDSYTHFAYANSGDGATDFSTTYFDGARYIGILVDRKQTDSTTYSDYTWSQFLGDSGLSAPPELTESITPYWQASANATGVTPATGTWSQTPVVPTEALRYLWYYETVAYNAPEQGRNMLRDSTNQWSYTTRSYIYIAKISLWEPLVAGETYTIVFSVDDLSKQSTGNVTVRTLYNSSANTRIQATIKVHEGNLYRATFTALDATEATQVAIYIGVSGFTATSPEVCPTVHWAMLTRGDTAYSWQAAPQDLTYSTTPDVRSQYPEQGAGFAGVSLLRNRAESWWQTEIAKATETWGVGNTGEGMAADIVAACRVGDIFAIYGEATDTHNNYILYHQYTGASGDTRAKGKYVMHTVSKAGAEGNGISSTTEYYLVSNLMTGVTRSTSGWQGSIATPTEDKPYLWNYEDTLYTNGTHRYTTPHIVSTYNRSAGGSSFISGVYNYYLVTATGSGVTRTNVPADASWVQCPPKTPPVPTAAKRYLWNYEMTTWDAPEQGRNLLVSKVANGRYTMSSLPDNGTTVTASVRLTVPEGKTHVKFALYGKSSSGSSSYSTQLNLKAETGALQTITGTFAFNPAAYTDITEFRVYVTTGANTGMALASDIEWVKLEKGALPTPYSEAPENLTEYTDAHLVCVYGENGQNADHYELSPVTEEAQVYYDANASTTNKYRLGIVLQYEILHVVGVSINKESAIDPTNADGLFIRRKYVYANGSESAYVYLTTGNSPSYTPSAITYSNTSTTRITHVAVELVRKNGSTYTVVNKRIVNVVYKAEAVVDVDQTNRQISLIVQGSSQDDDNALVNKVAKIREDMDGITSTVESHTQTIGDIPTIYATKTSVEQTASSITSKVQNQMLNGANLLINSKDQTSGFNSSSSSAYDKTQTNTYYACYYFGADKPTAGDTFTVSWKQINATGATKYRIYLFTDVNGVYLNPTAINSNANGLYSVTVNPAENFPASVTKVALYVSSGTPSTLANVEWAKAEYGTTASAWNPNISETGSEISQTANEIRMQVENVGININDKQITLNGNTQVNGTLKLDGSGDGFQLLSNTGTALITPESIGTYTDFQQTNKVTINPNFTGVREYIRENGYYRMGMSTQTKELGTFDAGSQIEVTHCSAQIYLYQNGYSRLTGTISGTISFYENNVLKETKTFPYTGTYTTQTTGDVKVLIDPVPTFFTVRQSGTGVPQAEADSYDLMDAAYYAGNPNALWMIYMTFRVPVPGAYVRVASDGVGVKTSNGNTAYFGPSGMHISPLLQNVTKVTTTNYSASVNDDVIIVSSSSSSAVSITLPTGGGIPEGKVIYVKNVGQASTCNVWALDSSGSGTSQRMYAHDSNTASPSVNIGRKMSFFISFDTGSGIGWLQGYCG